MESQRRDPTDPLASEIDAALEGVDLQNLDHSPSLAGERSTPERGERRQESGGRRGTVVGRSGDDVFVELGPRMQGVISVREFEAPPQVGESFEFTLHGREDDLWLLARRSQVRTAAIGEELEPGALVKARVTGQNTGGLELRIGSTPAFMPASQVGLRHEDNLASFLTQTLVCEVLEVDRERKRVLVSRRAVLERERETERKESAGKLSTGQVLKGKVTRIESFGAFVDLGHGLEGLLHVSNISRKRVENPAEVLAQGQQIDVQVLDIKEGGKRIGLGMKQLEADPWVDAGSRYAPDRVLSGKVTRISDFGAFVEIEPGLEGLIHVSQLSKDRVRRARDVLKVGEEVSVRVLSVEPARQRLSLSRLDARGALLGSDEAVDASVIDAALSESPQRSIGTNLGSLFKKIERRP